MMVMVIDDDDGTFPNYIYKLPINRHMAALLVEVGGDSSTPTSKSHSSSG